MSIEDAILLKNASKSKHAANKRNMVMSFWKEYGAVAHMTLKSKYTQLRKPRLSCVGSAVTATWGLDKIYLSVTSLVGSDDVFVLLERENEVLLEEDFRVARLAVILKAAFDFQKVDRKD
jgi:hypothetical protein